MAVAQSSVEPDAAILRRSQGTPARHPPQSAPGMPSGVAAGLKQDWAIGLVPTDRRESADLTRVVLPSLLAGGLVIHSRGG